MTAYTTRLYPYPQAADAANGPANMQALAAAVDSDVSTSMPPLTVSTFGDLHTAGLVGTGVSTSGAANRALTVLFRPKEILTPTKFIWYCTTQSGNVDGAVYNATTLARLWSKGSTACPAAGTITWAVAGLTLQPGVKYLLAWGADNNTAALRAATLATADLGTTYAGAIGVGYVNGSFALPNPIGALTAGTVLPHLALRA